MSLKFGTSGLRGLSVDLKGRASAIYATAFAQHLLQSGLAKKGDPVLVGRDFRDSSPEIASVAIGALSRAGFRPMDAGCVPTPALALMGLSLKAASLMVTGSHIPADRNGIKFYRPDGEIDKNDEQAISALASAIKDIDQTPGEAEDCFAACVALFTKRNEALLPRLALSGRKVGVYQHSTVARDMLADILSYYGASVIVLGRSGQFIPVDTEAVSVETVDLIKSWTAEHALDAIVSADGDGDRPLLSDEHGEPLRGDLLGLISARFLGAEVVATPVTSNSGIESSGGYSVHRTRVGSPYVIAAMQEALAKGMSGVMGFEANGGLLTASTFTVAGQPLAPLPTRDSFLPILAALYLASTQEKTLSEVVAGFRLPIAAADRLEDYPIERSSRLMASLRQSRSNLEAFVAKIGTVVSVSDVDGLRITFDDGRIIHFRPSGNAPEMRCYVEAPNQAEADRLLADGLKLARDFD